MGKKSCKKVSVFVAIFLIEITSVSSIIPIVTSSHPSKILENSFRTEEKADLVIEGLSHFPDTVQYQNRICCVIKNIGNKTVTGDIDLKVEIKRVYFGIFLNNNSVRHYFVSMWSTHGLPPGESTEVDFATDVNLPFWGFFRFYCWVNPNQTVEESNSSNNFFLQQVHVKVGQWTKAI